jgi:hypothetical protein
MKSDDSDTVILVHETILQSFARDAGTFATIAGLVAVGVFLDSTALQWIGAIMGFCAVIARASGTVQRSRMTVAQARTKLDEIEARP